MREVAIDAVGSGMVGAFLPRIEIRLHDVAVGAILRIGREVAPAFAVIECEDTYADEDSHQRGKRQTENTSCRLHPDIRLLQQNLYRVFMRHNSNFIQPAETDS